ncbi:alpha/beta hydrolase [Gordonia shandongensis]|uniref:alpha/beta hydrolase n=1 Tax=Gordonia shandongensis TaxID=376351 RepID=UPI0004223A3F|nr:alpha/beta hydrolase [Gordonia shandongensis]
MSNTDGVTVVRDDVVAERAEFFSGPHRIAAVVYTPRANAETTRPGVVVCNGMRGIKEWIVPRFGEYFAAAGYTAVVFDHRGLGESGGEPGSVLPQGQVEDVRNAVTFLESRPDVDPNRIVLWGTSFGGANAICAAAVDTRVKAVATQVAFGDWGRVLRSTLSPAAMQTVVDAVATDRRQRVHTGRSAHISPDLMLDNDESRAAKARSAADVGERPELTFTVESVERIMEYRPEAVIAEIAPRPILIIGSAVDGVIPFSESESLFALAGEPKELVSLPIGHYDICEPPGSDEAAQLAVDFFAPIVLDADPVTGADTTSR